MRRHLAAVAVWLAATLAAVALATAAIGTVVGGDAPQGARIPVADPTPSPESPGATPSAPAPSTTAPTTGAEERTYDLVGGSVAVRRTGQRVQLRWATPANGFEVEVDDEDGDEVDVEFRGDAHRSRLRVWVEQTRLRAVVDEDPR